MDEKKILLPFTAKPNFFANTGIIVGVLSAGFIATFISVEILAIISAVTCFVNAVFALQIREKNFYSEQLNTESVGFIETFKKAGIFIKGSGIALIAILFLVFFASFGNYLDEFDAFIINDFELTHIWISVIFVVRYGFMALGDVLAPIVQKKVLSIKQIFLLSVLANVFLVTFAAIWNQFAILIFGISMMILAIAEILLMNALQNEIKEEGRATVTSFISVGQNIFMICFSLVFALLAGIFPLQQVYIIISVYGISGGLLFYFFSKVKSIKN